MVIGTKAGPTYSYIPSSFGTSEVPNDVVITWGTANLSWERVMNRDGSRGVVPMKL